MFSRLSTRLLNICIYHLCNVCSLEKVETILVDAIRVGCLPDITTYNKLISAYSRFSGPDRAYLVVHRMKEAGFKPDVVTYNSLLSGATRHGMVSRSCDIFEEMLRIGIGPDLWTYNILLHCLFKSGYLEEACKVYQDMTSRGIIPCATTYNILINGLCLAGHVSLALLIFRNLMKIGIRAELVTYNTIINGLCKSGFLIEAQEILEELKDYGYIPNVVTYTTVMKGYFRAHNFYHGLRILYEMMNKGLGPDTFMYCTVISGLVKFKCIHCAHFYKIKLENFHRLDTVCINTIAHMFSREGDMKNAQMWLAQIEKLGLQSDTYTHCIMVEMLCKTGYEAAALSYIYNLQKRDSHSNLVACNSVIHRFCSAGKVDAALELFNKMDVRDCVTYTSLLHGLCVARWFQTAFKIMMRCLKEHVYVPPCVRRKLFVGLRTSGFKREVIDLRKASRRYRRLRVYVCP